jgi:hypothetical protein
MGRRKTIYVDEMKLLAAICRITKGDIEMLTKEADRLEAVFNADRSGHWRWTEAWRTATLCSCTATALHA